MGQFVSNAIAQGHEIWAYPNHSYPEAHTIPTNHIEHIRTMRRMDALYVRVERSTPDVCAWAVPPRRSLYRFPVVVWEFNAIPNDVLSESAFRRGRQSLKHYSQGCDLAICMTLSLAEHIQKGLNIQRILLVPNASDPEQFRPDLPVVKRMLPFQDKFNVVWMGSAKEIWHDFKMLSEAARILWETNPDGNVVYHNIGPDPSGVMADMPPNIYYWGAEYYGKLPNWLSGMDVGLNLYRPGPWDNAPLKVFDYMASGLAVVSTPQPFMRALLEKLEQPDLLVPLSDSQRLVEILTALASDRERTRRKGQAGRQLVIDYYNWERAVRDTMNEIGSILREKGMSLRQ